MKAPIGLLATTLLLATPVAFAGGSSPVEDALADAHAATKRAADVGYEWRDTGKILKKAEQAATAGNDDQAIALARKAEEQSKDAYAQYQRYYKNAGPRF